MATEEKPIFPGQNPGYSLPLSQSDRADLLSAASWEKPQSLLWDIP